MYLPSTCIKLFLHYSCLLMLLRGGRDQMGMSVTSLSFSTWISILLYCSTLKKVRSSERNSFLSMVQSPLTSSRLKMSSMSSVDGSSPPTRLMRVLTTLGNSPLVKRWFLSWSNSLKIFSSNCGMSSSLNLRLDNAITCSLQQIINILKHIQLEIEASQMKLLASRKLLYLMTSFRICENDQSKHSPLGTFPHSLLLRKLSCCFVIVFWYSRRSSRRISFLTLVPQKPPIIFMFCMAFLVYSRSSSRYSTNYQLSSVLRQHFTF